MRGRAVPMRGKGRGSPAARVAARVELWLREVANMGRHLPERCYWNGGCWSRRNGEVTGRLGQRGRPDPGGVGVGIRPQSKVPHGGRAAESAS
jgi:hypothetical protein